MEPIKATHMDHFGGLVDWLSHKITYISDFTHMDYKVVVTWIVMISVFWFLGALID